VGWYNPGPWLAEQLEIEDWQLSGGLHRVKKKKGLKGADDTKIWYEAFDDVNNGNVLCELTGKIIGNILDEY
jgi:hypothetical protein